MSRGGASSARAAARRPGMPNALGRTTIARARRCGPRPTTTATASTSPPPAGAPEPSARSGERDAHPDGGARAGRALDVDRAVDGVDAVGDTDHAAARRRGSADPVVAHDEVEHPAFVEVRP